MSRAASVLLAAVFAAPAMTTAAPPTRNYYLYVCAESDDTVHKLRFGPGGLEQIKKVPVGSFPAETEGPHGINVSPDKRYWFVSIAHGMPFGSIHKYEAETDEWLADVSVGMFPATLVVSPATGLLFAVNFDLHGDMKPSTISVVETSTMLEVARIDTGIMPHGARLNDKGTRLYSVNMMGDDLVEVDTFTFEVSRTLSLESEGDHDSHDAGRMSSKVKPTWATGPTPQNKLYIAGNGNNVIYEIDVEGWRISRTFDTGPGMGPYNLDLTSDGRLLVVTYKSGAHIGIWEVSRGKELARIKTTRTVPHGIAVSDDDRYAFVTLEGVGGEPGTVEVYDLETNERVATADVGKQAGGITFWKGEP